MSRYKAKYQDPEGKRWGFPTYAWGWSPEHLLTKRQLRARDLRPGGHGPVAQLRWGEKSWAYLYDSHLAQPVRKMTPGRQRTLDAMMRVRSTCRQCGHVADWCLPQKFGRVCVECGGGYDLAA